MIAQPINKLCPHFAPSKPHLRQAGRNYPISAFKIKLSTTDKSTNVNKGYGTYYIQPEITILKLDGGIGLKLRVFHDH